MIIHLENSNLLFMLNEQQVKNLEDCNNFLLNNFHCKGVIETSTSEEFSTFDSFAELLADEDTVELAQTLQAEGKEIETNLELDFWTID